MFFRAIPALPEVVRPAALGSRPQLDLSPVSPAEFSDGNDGHMGVQPCYGGGKVHTVVCLYIFTYIISINYYHHHDYRYCY